jgi:hypothetical protein
VNFEQSAAGDGWAVVHYVFFPRHAPDTPEARNEWHRSMIKAIGVHSPSGVTVDEGTAVAAAAD